jgi:hypothetical protein
VVNVANGAHVHVRLGPFKFLFSHFNSPKNFTRVLVLRLHQIAGSLRTGTEWHLIADRIYLAREATMASATLRGASE